MIQYFVNILPFEKRISKLRDLESEENELRIRVEDISSKLNLSNSIIKSIDSVPILEKAKSNQGDFIKELGAIHRRMKDVAVIKERLLRCEDIQKAIKQDGVKERYQKTKDLFKRNVITQKVWKESYKVLTGSDKVCYSDVIVYHCGKVLLLERSKIGIGDKNIGWCVPGGHVDPGEDFIQAAERELREETGIVLSEGCQLEIRGEFESDEIHIVYFEVYLQDEPILVLDNEEHKQYCWVEPKEFDKYPMIFDMAQNLHAILGTGEVYVTKIEDVSKAIEEDEIEKGRKAQIGEVREWKDGKWQRTKDGWIPYKEKGSKGEAPSKALSKLSSALEDKFGFTKEDPISIKDLEQTLESNPTLGDLILHGGGGISPSRGDSLQKIAGLMVKEGWNITDFQGKKEESVPTLETFKELAKKSKDVKGFMEEAQKIKNVPPEVANEFFEKYGDEGSLSIEGAAKKFFEEFGKKEYKITQAMVDYLKSKPVGTIEQNIKEYSESVGISFSEEETKDLVKQFQSISDREKNPFHNKELKMKLGNKAIKAVQEGKGDEYTRTVAADYGLTFREANDLLAESTKLVEDE